MQDLLSAGFIPLRLDRQSNVERNDASVEELRHGFHRVYTSIEYKCASPLYRHTGSSRRTCLKTGRWSGHHVSCSPGEHRSSFGPVYEMKQQLCIATLESLHIPSHFTQRYST